MFDASGYGGQQIFQFDDPDDAFDFLAWNQAQCDLRNNPKKSISADGQREQLGIFPTAASMRFAVWADQHERLHVANYRLETQPASVGVGGQRAADGQAVSTGLLLTDGPRPAVFGLGANQVVDQFGPLDAALHFDQAVLRVEVEHAAEVGQVKVQGV